MSLMSIIRGDSKVFTVTLREPDGTPLNLEELDDIWFTAKHSRWDSDADAVFQKTVGAGITVTSAAQGLAEIEFLPEETASLTDLRTLRCDIQVQFGDDIKTPWMGKLTVLTDVTRVTA